MNDCPEWLEAQTYDYARSVIEGYPDDPHDLEIKHANEAYQALISPSLSHVWRRAGRFFEGDPVRGQQDLFVLIICCRKFTDKKYGTQAEVLTWRESFVRKLDELQDLWINMPAGLCIPDESYFDLISGGSSQGGEEGLITKLESIMPQNDPLKPIMAMREAIMESFHYDPAHLTQVRGGKADRVYFVRVLSRHIMRKTGQWKREIVADITSFLFDCTFTAADVVRCTKGVPKETEADNIF
ncbi:MAG: hypothetical protein NXH81_07300 [Halieaceae bacterium]|uniref:hypothetical protein n=1 Tax=Haliea alexandrii TaxID=2448162 RepID=UPI000F0BA4AD|nr:hypothetical protein [Haliea alexandrii]MCR9185184.1 hypothetical protein [Halieaceae bacterium]